MIAMPSLFKRLLFGFLCVILPVWLALLALFLVNFHESSNRMEARWMRLDAEKMLDSLRAISDRPDAMRNLAKNIERLQSAYYAETGMEHRYRVQVWQRGLAIYGSQGLPVTASPTLSGDGSATLAGSDWNSWVAQDAASGLTVRVAQENGPAMLSTSSLSLYLLPLIIGFPFLAIPTWLIIRSGLRPLALIVRQIEVRSGSELSCLAASPYKELTPLVSSVNSLLERLSQRLLREKEFLADAAHELKTPLAIIQLNSDALIGPGDAARLQQAHAGLSEGVARATHTVHQLLALGRLGIDQDAGLMRPLDLAALLRNRLVLAVQLALRRGVEIEIQAPDSCELPLHRESIASLIDNIIDNAIKYSPAGAQLVVNLQSNEHDVQLCVSDRGPGIAPELRRKVFERFFRVSGQDQAGSGLGLAIAEAAAQRNGANITLETGVDGVGLTVRVYFSKLA